MSQVQKLEDDGWTSLGLRKSTKAKFDKLKNWLIQEKIDHNEKATLSDSAALELLIKKIEQNFP